MQTKSSVLPNMNLVRTDKELPVGLGGIQDLNIYLKQGMK